MGDWDSHILSDSSDGDDAQARHAVISRAAHGRGRPRGSQAYRVAVANVAQQAQVVARGPAGAQEQAVAAQSSPF